MRAMKKVYESTRVLAPLQVTLVIDTHLPRKNGLSAHISRMVNGLSQREHEIHLIRPRMHKHDGMSAQAQYTETLVTGIPVLGYPGLKSGLPAKGKLLRLWRIQRPDVVHIATEGPLGWSALSAAREMNIPVSTDIHSSFHRRARQHNIGFLNQPVAAYLRHFHNKAACTLVSKHRLQQQLSQEGYQNVRVVSNIVDTELFHPVRRRIKKQAETAS